MTVPTTPLWNSQKLDISGQQEAVERLSRMTAGNDHLVTEPGLTLALFQGNATPQQAQAIDSFLGALKAEQAVRTAAAAGTKIPLSDEQKTQLTQMGVNYSPVEYTQQDALTDLTAKMAAQGMRPVLDQNGNVQVDKNGNVISEALPKKKKSGGGWFDSVGSFFHHVTHNPVTHFVGNSLQGNFSTNDDINNITGGSSGVGGAITALNEGYQYLSSEASQNFQTATDPIAGIHASEQNANLAKQLGYDPSSFFSMQAFQARGYVHKDTSAAAAKWDTDNPNGLFGMNGEQAVTEAEVFAADPAKYTRDLNANSGLTPEQVAQRTAMANSKEFSELVQRVSADKASIGDDFATGLGIDPVKHPAIYSGVSVGTDLVASMFLDPTVAGLSAFSRFQRAGAAIKGWDDAEGITRILTNPTTMSARRSAYMLHDVVDLANEARAAKDAGDLGKLAQVQAKATQNKLGGLLSDFMGEDQILRLKTSNEVMAGDRKALPFVTGAGDPIDTYEKAVSYVASKSALIRLAAGHAPVEFAVMPGAMSSWAYTRLKGTLMGWSAARSAEKTAAATEKLLSRAEADPAFAQSLLNDKIITKVLPAVDDAVEMLSGRVLAAKDALTAAPDEGGSALASARRALEDHQANTLANAPLDATDATAGYLRGNQLRYGLTQEPSTRVGKALSIYTLGAIQRAKMIVTRMTNFLPSSTAINIENAAAAEDIRRAARTYLSSGDANLMAMRWTLGSSETRRAIVEGLEDQIFHASGMSRTQAGMDWYAERQAEREAYSTTGDEWLDANGRPSALYGGQVQKDFTLPNFGQVHKAAAKVGLFENTLGRALNADWTNRLLSTWRLGVLMSPVTANRAITETWLAGGADGMFIDALRAKAYLREGDKLVGEIDRTKAGNLIANAPVLRSVGRFYTHVLSRGLTQAEKDALAGQADDLFYQPLHEQAMHHWAQEVDPGGHGEATEHARLGLGSKQITLDTSKGFDAALQKKKGFVVTDELRGIASANAYAHNLAMRVNADPSVARALLDRIEHPDEHTIDDVVAAMDKSSLLRHTSYGQRFRLSDGTETDALTDAEKTLGKQQRAQTLVDDFSQLLTGRNAVFQKKVADYIRQHGTSPNADWLLDNLKEMDRPNSLVRPVWEAVPGVESGTGINATAKDIVDSINGSMGKAYRYLVERQIQRNATSPFYAAAYAKSRVSLEGFKQKLIEGGLTDEAAERSVQNVAGMQGWNRIALMVDDPRMKSQMDVVGRSFFAFSRATTTMLRRWGGIAWRNPAQARRMQLAAEGAVNSGLVFKDQNGNWDFYLPATGVAQEVLFHAASNIPGLQGLAKFPTADFTGNVSSIIPGSNNPFQYNTNPIVSISGRTVASLFPNQREIFDEIDRKLNGTQGQGQGILDTLSPRLFKQFKDAEMDDSRNSVLSSAMVGSLYYLYSAGLVPKDGASASDQQQFLDRLKLHTRSVLFTRFLLGTISPATLATPHGADAPVDFAYAKRGVQNLRDEYLTILNDTNGDLGRANAIWTALHPDDLVYTVGGSTSTTKGADVASTEAAYNWMAKHTDFISKYQSVAAFFVPQAKQGDPFSYEAYRAQLEQGLRQKKTPQEMLDSIRVSGAASVYYAMEDQYNADVAAAKAAGDTATVTARNADWAAWSAQFKAQNPTFAEHVEATPANTVAANKQLGDLQSMVAANAVPGGADMKAAVAGMVQAYTGFRQFEAEHRGTDTESKAQRAAAFTQLQDYLSSVVAAVPETVNLYNGVFRVLSGYNLASIGN